MEWLQNEKNIENTIAEHPLGMQEMTGRIK
jgi:hypothetical protein